MNLPDQVLSIKQIQELTELRFDVSKYASMCWLKEPNGDKLLITTLDESCYEAACMNPVPTLTIADIIDILLEVVNKKYYLEISKHYVGCYEDEVSVNGEVEEKLIEAFFETLKWCITEKHI